MRCVRPLARLSFVIAIVFIPVRLIALDSDIPLSAFQLKSWTVQEGYALGEILSLAQTPDGFLWLATSRGLRRFDGVNFTRWNGQSGGALDDARITALCVSRDGALWVGTANALHRLADGHLKSFTAADGLPNGGVFSLLEDRKGLMWVGMGGSQGRGLASIKGAAIRRYGQVDGLPDDSVYSLFEDRREQLWIGFSKSGACEWHPGTAAICPVPPPGEVHGIAEGRNGDLIFDDLSARTLTTLRMNGNEVIGPEKQVLPGRPVRQLLDRDGNLWISTSGSGLLRYRDGITGTLTQKEGSLSNFIDVAFEDRDGNLWIGTPRGLMRLRNPVASHLAVPGSNLPAAVLPTDDHRVWVGSLNSGLRMLDGTSFSEAIISDQSVYSLHQFGRTLLVGARDGLVTFTAGQRGEIRRRDGAAFEGVNAMGDDGRTLWLMDVQGRIFRMEGNYPERVQSFADKRARAIYVAPDGLLWTGFADGALRTIRGTGSPLDPLDHHWRPGAVYAITGDRTGSVWIGARGELGRYRNGRWTVWGAAEGIPRGGIYSLCISNSGLWVMTSARLIYIPRWSLDATPDGVPQPLLTATFGADDGIELLDTGTVASPAMAFMPDGRLLVATVAAGLAVLDTHRIQMASRSQSAFIDEFMVDGQSVPLAPEPQVRGRRFEFRFTVPNIAAADSSRMYYHLDGVDPDWIEAREDRRAIYGLLRPGEYRFRVKAPGATNGAGLTFRIPPRLSETAYFPFLLLCALGLAGWGIYLLRVRHIEDGMRLVFEERLRVTRDMHDGLLQGFTAVTFQLDTAVQQFDRAPEECRTRLKNALEQADSSMKEARHAISLLRLPALENQLLSAALDKMGKQVTEGLGAYFSSSIENADSLPYTVQASLYVIARELISNAATHASASRIELRLECTERSFCLVVEDNGIGFEPTQMDPQTGHIGLSSVRERARLIEATVTIDSKPGKGTRCSISGRQTKKQPVEK